MRWFRLVLRPLVAVSFLAQGSIAQAGGVAGPGTELVLLEIVLNGASTGASQVVRSTERTYVPREKLEALGLATNGEVIVFDGEEFLPLDGVSGLRMSFEATSQRLILNADPALLARQRRSPDVRPVEPSESVDAAFLDYDLTFESEGDTSLAGLVEAGVSGKWGVTVSNVLLSAGSHGTAATRLDTSFVRDNPAAMTRLVLGDALTSPDPWLPQVRFGGIRYGTDFSLQPGIVTFPMPSYSGSAALPSQVQLIVDGATRYRSDVASGPFSIEQVPLVAGAGRATLVTRDIRGVEHSVDTSYYIGTSLLRPGLSDWSVEAGFERRGFGTRSFDYGAPFVAGSYRRGLSNALTAGVRSEVTRHSGMADMSLSIVLLGLAELSLTTAVSKGEGATAGMSGVSVRRVARAWSLAASYQHASTRFASLGQRERDERLVDQWSASGGLSLGKFGSLGVGYSRLAYADKRRASVATANYGLNVGSRAYLAVFALDSWSDRLKREMRVGIGLSMRVGRRSSAYAQADSQGVRAEVRQTVPYEGGLGYRLAAARGQLDREQAELSWRGDMADLRVELARFQRSTAFRAQASGGLLLAGGMLAASRRVEDGVALVEVPGLAHVRLFQDNRLVGTTDGEGRAIVANLRPYEENEIGILADDVPMEASLGALSLTVVPRLKGASRVHFDVERSHPAILVVKQSNGAPLETGSKVWVAGGSPTFVGLDSRIFLSDARPGTTLTIETAAGSCGLILGAEFDTKAPEPFYCRLAEH